MGGGPAEVRNCRDRQAQVVRVASDCRAHARSSCGRPCGRGVRTFTCAFGRDARWRSFSQSGQRGSAPVEASGDARSCACIRASNHPRDSAIAGMKIACAQLRRLRLHGFIECRCPTANRVKLPNPPAAPRRARSASWSSIPTPRHIEQPRRDGARTSSPGTSAEILAAAAYSPRRSSNANGLCRAVLVNSPKILAATRTDFDPTGVGGSNPTCSATQSGLFRPCQAMSH